MLSYFDLRKGTYFIYNNQPYEVLDFSQIYKAQDAVVARTKIKNLITGAVIEKTFHQGEFFEEAEIKKIKLKFLYSHREKFVFQEINNSSLRKELKIEQIKNPEFLKPQMEVEGIEWEGQIIQIIPPLKVILRVAEAPPSLKGERAQGNAKQVVLENGLKINAPSFIKEGDLIEINTETKEYCRRVNQ